MRKIALFCCGGTGTNLGAEFAKYRDEKTDGLAELATYFIDTSRSNAWPSISDEHVFLYKKPDGAQLDGNGKVRSSNYDVLSESAKINQILNQFKPEDLNIVIHSGGGGTGSVAGPLLVKELIKRKQVVIVIMVGSTTSMLDVKNTLNTLKTYENFAQELGQPINLLYRENSKDRKREEIDNVLRRYIFLLAMMFSGQNHGLDSSDLRNFLNSSTIVGLPPRLTAIDLFAGQIVLPQDSVAIGAISLVSENEEVDLGIMVEYHVQGIVHPKARDKMEANLPLHAAVFSGFFPPHVAKLQSLLNQHEAQTKMVSERTITSSTDQPNRDGLIL